MKRDDYVGICRVCFEPIIKDDEFSFSSRGWKFHQVCSVKNPDSYYFALDRIKHQFECGMNPTKLMNEMERIFKIPALIDDAYNEENSDVIKLYRIISDSRSEDMSSE